jgi:hypothetical protein
MTVVAHIGHWLVDLLYVAPLLLLLAVLAAGKVRERRSQRARRTD